jgi:hypothetical protein
MSSLYLPASEFLKHVLNDDAVLDASAMGRHNIRKLLSMVDDADPANCDWAAFLIAALPYDNSEIRAILLRSAEGDDIDTRNASIVALSRRDRKVALARLRPLLAGEVGTVLLHAATILGDQNLAPLLKCLDGWNGEDDAYPDQLMRALAACEAGVGTMT